MTARSGGRRHGAGLDTAGLLLLACASACGRSHDPVGKTPFPSSSPGAAEGRARDLASDDRIAWLLAPCPHPEAFLADTGDPVAVLVSKLAHGQLDPLRQAKTELAQMGEAALPELRRFCDRERSDPQGAQHLLNALSVVGAMETHAGRDLLVAALGQPEETVRMEAVRGLARHAAPEDYDRLMALVPIASSDALTAIGGALETADRMRFEDDFVAWLAGPRQRASLWIGAAERVCDTSRPEILARFREIYPHSEGDLRFYLAAAVARAGDAETLAELRAALKDENPTLRSLVARALERVGLTREIAPLLWEDRDEALRALVARAVAALPPSQETTGWLRKGTDDRARSVRIACLAVLAERGDAEARDQGLLLLEGNRSDLEYGISVLRGAWAKDTALAARALDRLERLRSGQIQPVRVEVSTLDRAIAQVPLADAARALFERAQTASGDIEQLPAYRWYLMQAGNTGPVGRAWLRERWADEVDPARRVDIAMAGTYDKDDESRAFLLRITEDERSTPLEVLYAANLLVHQGPAATVAPRLKRVTLRIADPRVRPALNCLLWQWYGEEP